MSVTVELISGDIIKYKISDSLPEIYLSIISRTQMLMPPQRLRLSCPRRVRGYLPKFDDCVDSNDKITLYELGIRNEDKLELTLMAGAFSRMPSW